MEELRAEQRCHGTERISHKSLGGDGRGSVVTVAVGGEAVAGLEDEEDAEGDAGEAEVGADPVDEAVLGEAVDEEADGEEDGAAEGAVETGFGGCGAGVRVGDGAVFADLDEVQGEGEGDADAEGDVGEAGDAFGPVFLFGKGDADDRQEEEGDEPGEGNPETEEKDDGLRDQHVECLDRRVV